MVVCIDEFLQKIHQGDFQVTKVTALLAEIGPDPDDDDPDDDPPSAIRLAA